MRHAVTRLVNSEAFTATVTIDVKSHMQPKNFLLWLNRTAQLHRYAYVHRPDLCIYADSGCTFIYVDVIYGLRQDGNYKQASTYLSPSFDILRTFALSKVGAEPSDYI